jgi:nitrite reductase/ring-hydroxylating ferredoxin subunit
MNMAEFVEALALDQLQPGTSKMVRIVDKEVALFNVEGTVYAINDTCVHAGSSLAAGEFEGNFVTCRSHGWRYDVTTGELTTAPGYGVSSHAVEIVDGKIMVAVNETPSSTA